MDNEQWIQIISEAGFVKAALIETKDLVFVHEYRKFCEQNYCGNYGRNYACPPYCGTPECMEAKVRKYSQALVFQSQSRVENIFDDKETDEIKKEHTKRMKKALIHLYEEGLSKEGLSIMAGSCTVCKDCNFLEGKPCRQPEKRTSCLSAYCIDAGQMAKKCQMDMEWNGEIVSFFSLYVFEKNE